MHLGGCGRVTFLRGFRHRVEIFLLVSLLLASGVAGASPVWGPHTDLRPPGSDLGKASGPFAAASPPTIFSFSASPSEIFQGSSTSFFVDAFSSLFDPLSYSYSGLPPGCSSADSSFLFCAPTSLGYFNVTVTVTDTINLAAVQAFAQLSVDPVANGNFFSLRSNVVTPFEVNFTESGLPFGTSWSVTLGPDLQGATTSQLQFLEMDGTYAFSVAPVAGRTPSPAFGNVSVSGANIDVTILFGPTYPVFFNESFLNFGTKWSVTVNGTTHSSYGSQIQFLELAGTYAYTINNVSGYTMSVQSGSVTVTPTGYTSVVVYFFSFGPPAYPVTFSETGLPVRQAWSVLWNGVSLYTTTSSSIVLSEANGTYPYSVLPIGGYNVAPSSGSVTVFSPFMAPIDLVFSAQPTYMVTFNETGLPLSTSWNVTLNSSVTQSSSSNQILFSEPNAVYSYAITPIMGYVAVPATGFVTVAGVNPAPIHIVFKTQAVRGVTFRQSGLPGGTSWSVTLNGSRTQTSSLNWIQFVEPNATYRYSVGFSEVGSARDFSVLPQTGFLVVNGTPVVVNVTFTRISTLGRVDSACSSISSPPFYQNFCYPEAQTPSLVTFSNGTVGLGSELYTNSTTNLCAGAVTSTVARLGFALSTTNGTSFGPSRSLGWNGCKFLNAIEPSFAASGTSVYAAFVLENSTAFAANYIARGTDALGFLRSSDGGKTFSPAVALDSAGSIARPSIAVSGNSIYIVFENIANSSTPLPGGSAVPIAVEWLYSTNGGTTWHGPSRLPGLNASQQYTAMSPSVTVSSSGLLAVAYATDRHCLAILSGNCTEYGDQIVAVTSNTNGSTWNGPAVLGQGGETLCYTGACYSGFFESTPQVAAAFSPNGSSLYVAYAATYDQGASLGAKNFNHTGIFVASDTGGVVTGGPVVAPSGPTALRSFNPGLGVSSSAVYLTYTQANESPGSAGLANSLSQWVRSSAVGPSLQWTPPAAVDVLSFVSGGSVNSTRSSFPGFSASVGVSATGTPLIAFAWPRAPTTTSARGPGYFFVNTTYETDLVAGSLAVAGTPGALSITFTATGLPAGRVWHFAIDGIPYTLTTPSIMITNIPAGTPVLIAASYTAGFWEVVFGGVPDTLATYTSNQTVTLPFEVWEGLEFNTIPSGILPWLPGSFFGTTEISSNVIRTPFGASVSTDWIQFIDFTQQIFSSVSYSGFDFNGNFSLSWTTNCINVACFYQTPWYFPLGTTLDLYMVQSDYAQFAPIFWTGSGNGSYTGGMQGFCFDPFFCPASSGTIKMLGPVNETLWFGNAPANLQSNVAFSATGIPATSVYHVTLDSTNLTGNTSVPAQAPNLPAGAHRVTDIWANSSTAGWEYFGSVVGPNPFVSPVEQNVPLLFASFVNLSAPPGQVTFQATNLTVGTLWSISFNDTTYSSSTPWINVTTRPGTFGIALDDAVSPAGTTGYVPANGTGMGAISVVPGRSYTVGYVPAYQLELLASPGGFVSASGGAQQSELTVWEAAGSVVQLGATVTNGYTFGGWAGTGAGAYNGNQANPFVTMNGPVVESATFIPLPGARFNLTFEDSGLPTGALWTVDLNGAGYSSSAAAFQVGQLWPWSAGANGHYQLSVPVVYLSGTNLTRFVPSPYPAVVGTNGSATPPILLHYSPQEFVQLAETGSGTVEGTYHNSPLGSSGWVPQGGQVIISALPSPGSTFSGWQGTGNGSYTGLKSSLTISANGPVSEVAVFSSTVIPPPPTYSLAVHLDTPVANGTVWGVTVGGVGYTSSSYSLTIPGLAPGTYGMVVNTANAPSGLIQYRASATDPVSYTVSANGSLHVSLDPYYWVEVSASVGGTVSPGSGYYAANSILYLVASANSTYGFAGWSGTGTGAYVGTNSTASIIVTNPLTEVAQFHSNGGTTSVASIWSNPETWAGLGAVGLVAGIAVGVLLARFATRPKSMVAPPPKEGGPP